MQNQEGALRGMDRIQAEVLGMLGERELDSAGSRAAAQDLASTDRCIRD